MWMNLRAKRIELSARQLSRQSMRQRFTLAIPSIKLDGVDRADRRPDEHRLRQDVRGQRLLDGGILTVDHSRQRHVDGVLQENGNNAGDGMNRQVPFPNALLERKAPRQPEEWRREDGAGVPIGDVTEDERRPQDVLAAVRENQRGLPRGHEREQSPYGPDAKPEHVF